jgi:hypothetical protein
MGRKGWESREQMVGHDVVGTFTWRTVPAYFGKSRFTAAPNVIYEFCASVLELVDAPEAEGDSVA